jgi:hypothetical protein
MASAPAPRTPPRLFARNEQLAFLLEVVALLILAKWGWHHGERSNSRLLQAILAPLVAMVIWGLFASPRARYPQPLAGRLAVKALVFGAATMALLQLHRPWSALLFALVVTAHLTAATVWYRQGFRVAAAVPEPPPAQE